MDDDGVRQSPRDLPRKRCGAVMADRATDIPILCQDWAERATFLPRHRSCTPHPQQQLRASGVDVKAVMLGP